MPVTLLADSGRTLADAVRAGVVALPRFAAVEVDATVADRSAR